MAYKITYTKRFLKNVKKLNGAERAQLKKKLELLMHCGQSAFRAQVICLNLA